MTADQILAPARWRIYLGSMRAVVACSCLIHAITVSGNHAFAVLFALYAIYAAAVILVRALSVGGQGMFGLMLDTVLFLTAAWMAGDAGVWLVLLFYFYLLISAAVQHQPPQVALVFGISFAFFLLARPVTTPVMAPALLLSGIAISLLSIRKKGAEERFAAASRQVVLLRSEAENARESERQRIAADFHDGPLQGFVGLQMRIQVIKQLMDRDTAACRDEIYQLEEILKSQAGELRAFIRSMRPLELDGAGLIPSLRRLVETFEKDTGISANFAGGEIDSPTSQEASRELLQIVREALHNVQKHSKASRVSVVASRKGNSFEIAIEDDGGGFPFSGSYSLRELELLRVGPLSIRRRVRGIGGDLQLDSWPGRGAALRIRLGS
jgi:signal transduction histidine kinase